jgi:hypothetical protein
MTDAIIEAASKAMCDAADFSSFWSDGDEAWRVATSIIAAVTPLIRAAALEEAAKVAEEHDVDTNEAWEALDRIAAAIRALIPASPSPSADSA